MTSTTIKGAAADSTSQPDSVSKQDPVIARVLQTLDRLDLNRLEALYENPLSVDLPFEDLVIRNGLADEHQIAQGYANRYLLPVFDPPHDVLSPIHPSVASLLPASFCRDHFVAPLSDDGQTIEVAILSPDALSLGELIKRKTNRQMRALFSPRSVILRLLSELYPHDDADVVESFFDDENESDPNQPEAIAPNTSVSQESSQASQYLLSLLEHAFQLKASDIHLEPRGLSCRARLRVNGRLTDTSPPPLELLTDLMGEIKRVSKMDSVEDRLPQEGRIAVRKGGEPIDVRVSTCPTYFGEKVTLQLSNGCSVPNQLDMIGLGARQLSVLTAALEKDQGVILVTGPPGCGKATTLDACLRRFNADDRSVCTVEDSMRDHVDGVCHIETDPSQGLSQSTALQALLRQGTDVIMVSEISEAPIADLCFRAARSRHLILASLIARDAIDGINRLLGFGLDSALLADTLNLMVSQRVMRRICDACKRPTRLGATAARRIGLETGVPVFEPVGCAHCQQSGYEGKVAVFEVIPIDGTVRQFLRQGRSVADLQAEIEASDMPRLIDGIGQKLLAGITSPDEALRFCRA